MTTEEKANLEDSIRQRLLNLARSEGVEFQLVLTRYANERFLYRLGKSPFKTSFVLKGAALLTVWFEVSRRPTRDVDLLGLGSDDPSELVNLVRTVSDIEAGDGLRFDLSSVRTEQIREDGDYQGTRVKLNAYLGNARIPLHLDVAFGDALAVTPEIRKIPTLLDQASPELAVYPVEAVIAEKFEALVKLGIANSRMKDFWDIDLLISEMELEEKNLRDSILATFDRRKTALPNELPMALTNEFATDPQKNLQWRAFLRKNKLAGSEDLSEVIERLAKFFGPLISSLKP